LIKLWLKAPVAERDGDGKQRMSGGRSSKRGTPQGGVVSPLLSVVYMNRFLKHWRLTGRREAFRAHVVSYADDFVILSRGCAAEALAWTKAVMTKLGLTLNEAKTSVKDARQEGFDFLGYTLGPQHYRKDGHWYLGASPSKKSVQRIKTKIGDILRPHNKGAWPRVRDRLNRLMAHGCKRTGLSTTASTIAFDASSSVGTKCKGAARTGSPARKSTENWACCSSNARTLGRRREPCDEASRKAGCGQPARPV
jgi:RNA-directed DNA polymerase